jgi:hypothetical protein
LPPRRQQNHPAFCMGHSCINTNCPVWWVNSPKAILQGIATCSEL